jgi:hypothetical protein
VDPLPEEAPPAYPLEAANDYDPEEGERIPAPTEKIDLERIKEIIEKDAKQKADAARRRATQTHAVQRSGDAKRTQNTTSSAKGGNRSTANAAHRSGMALPGILGGAVNAFSKLPHAMRPVVVGIGAAVATILVVSIAQLFTGGEQSSSSSAPLDSLTQPPSDGTTTGDAQAGTSLLEPNQATELTDATVFPAIPGGLYAGQITGIIPGQTAPFSLISLPKQGMVAVIVGIEGWGPVLVPSTNSNGEPIQPLVVRSNGMILNITGAVSSGTIEGAFANAVTGETGSWQVRKVS